MSALSAYCIDSIWHLFEVGCSQGRYFRLCFVLSWVFMQAGIQRNVCQTTNIPSKIFMLLEFENFDVLPEIILEGLKLSNDCIRGGAVKTPVTDYILFTWIEFPYWGSEASPSPPNSVQTTTQSKVSVSPITCLLTGTNEDSCSTACAPYDLDKT